MAAEIYYHPSQDLTGRIAVAVGCTNGLGFAIAKRLAVHGAHVVLSSRRQTNVNQAVADLEGQGLKVSGFVCHAGKSEDRKSLIEYTVKEHGRIDILVNNAGVNPFVGKFLDTPNSALDKNFDVNVKANFYLIRDAVPHMGKNGIQGSILITSSGMGFPSHTYPGGYVVSKAALFTMTKSFMPVLLKRNIRINCLTHGPFHTKFSGVFRKDKKTEEWALDTIPMKRFADPEETAGIAAFLCSDDASYITGENFPITGGGYSRL